MQASNSTKFQKAITHKIVNGQRTDGNPRCLLSDTSKASGFLPNIYDLFNKVYFADIPLKAKGAVASLLFFLPHTCQLSKEVYRGQR